MTKGFYYNNSIDFAEEFEAFFNEPKAVDYFSTWLTHSFVVYVYDDIVEKITCSLADGVAQFNIEFSDHYGSRAGSATVLCTTELLNEFIDRIYDPWKYCQ